MTASIVSLREVRLARRQGALGTRLPALGSNDNDRAPLFAPGDYILARPLPTPPQRAASD